MYLIILSIHLNFILFLIYLFIYFFVIFGFNLTDKFKFIIFEKRLTIVAVLNFEACTFCM